CATTGTSRERGSGSCAARRSRHGRSSSGRTTSPTGGGRRSSRPPPTIPPDGGWRHERPAVLHVRPAPLDNQHDDTRSTPMTDIQLRIRVEDADDLDAAYAAGEGEPGVTVREYFPPPSGGIEAQLEPVSAVLIA